MTWQNRDNNVINIIMEKYMKVTGGQVDKHGEQQKYYHWENNMEEPHVKYSWKRSYTWVLLINAAYIVLFYLLMKQYV